MRKKIILENHQAPGDILMLTAAVRDLSIAHYERYTIDVRTPYPELWRFNPHLTSIGDDDREVEIIECHYPLIHRSNQTTGHFIDGFRQYLEHHLAVSIPLTKIKGDLHLSQAEKQQPSITKRLTGCFLPYWLINAGGKYDFTTKWWHPERYQQVIDAFAGHILFVQVGSESDQHPELSGVINLIGKTTLRDMIKLTYHADGVLTPVSFPMHLAAATPSLPGKPTNRACVVIAGGREPMRWEAYPSHQFIHTNGLLSCCDTGGCWKSRTLPLGDGDDKDRPENLCSDLINRFPRCLDFITPEMVAERIKLYYKDKRLNYLSKDQWEALEPHLHQVRKTPASSQIIHQSNPPVTICTLAYGDYPTLIQRCIESIQKCCDRSQYQLIVGANAVSDETRSYLEQCRQDKVIDDIIWRDENINKCPMMALMFEKVTTKYIWWFDDDSYVCRKDALEKRVNMAEASSHDVVMWGHQYFVTLEDFSQGTNVQKFIKSASWYGGKPIPTTQERWLFITGGNWFVKTDAIRKIQWPDSRLIKAADDVLICEAFRQQGLQCQDIGACGVFINTAKRRGSGEDIQTMKYQIDLSSN